MPLPLVTAAIALCTVASPPGGRAVLPASGAVVEGLSQGARWEVEGTIVVGERDLVALDRLLAFDDLDRRVLTLELRRAPCPAVTPGQTSPWPTLGYAAVRVPRPERRSVTSCKAPDLHLELRFPAGVEADPEGLLSEADRWEPVVIALHAAFGVTRVDLAGAIASRHRLVFEAAAGGPASHDTPLTLMSGAVVERPADGLVWLVRRLGGHDVVVLGAPTAAALAIQLLPFKRATCEQALAAAVKHLAAPAGVTPLPPPGWAAARAVGIEGVALCAAHRTGGMVVIGSARVPRETWLPIATPLLTSLASSLVR